MLKRTNSLKIKHQNNREYLRLTETLSSGIVCLKIPNELVNLLRKIWEIWEKFSRGPGHHRGSQPSSCKHQEQGEHCCRRRQWAQHQRTSCRQKRQCPLEQTLDQIVIWKIYEYKFNVFTIQCTLRCLNNSNNNYKN